MYIKYNPGLKNFSQQFREKPTLAEKEMWKFLKWQFPEFKFNRQKRLDNFVVDFYCKQFDLIIEVDGEVHEKQKERDSERDNILEVKHNLKVVRFTNNDVMNNKKRVKEKLSEILRT